MGGIRTLEQLAETVDGDLAWRKRELTALASALARAKGIEAEVLARGAWTLLYAHWEGFVKHACVSYLEYVSTRRLRVYELSAPLSAVALRASITAASSAKQGAAHTKLIELVRSTVVTARIPFDGATIKTNANLNYATYVDILQSIGCVPVEAADLQDALDSILLRQRNEIAHGRQLLVSLADWEQLREKVLGAMNDLRNQVENSAVTSSYRVAGSDA